MTLPYNFSPGPAMLPPEVLDQVRADLPEWHWHGVGQGASVMEVSHRGKAFEALIGEAEQDLRDLLSIPANYRVIFMQGGAWGQFAAVPMNLLRAGETADYLVSGGWSKSAVGEASKFGAVNVLASSENDGYTRVPARNEWKSTWTENGAAAPVQPGVQSPSYIYACSNETVYGNEIHSLPRNLPAPLVIDASSHFLSRPMDVSACGLIYAGAQKNIGPAGLVIVIVREDLLGKALPSTPSVMDFATMAENGSMLNTPPTFSIYLAGLIFKHLLAEGGVAAVEAANIAKARRLYDAIDGSGGFYCNPVAVDCRSRMNVPFTLADGALDAAFLAAAAERRLEGLKGHKSVGGMRASIYNAMSLDGVDALVELMQDFAARRA